MGVEGREVRCNNDYGSIPDIAAAVSRVVQSAPDIRGSEGWSDLGRARARTDGRAWLLCPSPSGSAFSCGSRFES